MGALDVSHAHAERAWHSARAALGCSAEGSRAPASRVRLVHLIWHTGCESRSCRACMALGVATIAMGCRAEGSWALASPVRLVHFQ
eukprot:4401662-Prymnesium_polylepis.2